MPVVVGKVDGLSLGPQQEGARRRLRLGPRRPPERLLKRTWLSREQAGRKPSVKDAELAQGLYAELDSAGSRIKVTDILPGYIRTDINRSVKTSLMTEFDPGVDALVSAIDAEPVRALVPARPWKVIGPLLTVLPERISRRFV